MLLQRNLSYKILKLLDLFPVVAIIGVRQSGKTELVKSLRPTWQYFDLEKQDDFELISRDPVLFFDRYPSDLILDEAQESPELFKTLRGVIDQNRSEKGRFLITGSSSPELLQNISESLAGRIAIIELGTLKLNERYQKPMSAIYQLFAQNQPIASILSSLGPVCSQNQLFQGLLLGGYPEPTIKSDPFFFRNWMENYFATYVNRDIRKLFPRLDIVRFRRFLGLLANLSGTIVKKSDIAASIDISEPTVKDYIDIADGTFIWRTVRSFEHNVKKAIVKMPKGHLRDTGLTHFILKIDSEDKLFAHPIIGRTFESFVIEEIIKGVAASEASAWSYHYYRTRAKSEIDLVLHGAFGVIPFEIKFGTKVPAKNINTLKRFAKEHSSPVGFVINNGARVEQLAENIFQIPANYL